MTYAKRVDRNQQEIVRALKKMGCRVEVTSHIGAGFADLVVGVLVEGKIKAFFVEVKDGTKPPSRRKLTAAEERFASRWPEIYYEVTSLKDAAEFVAHVKKWG